MGTTGTVSSSSICSAPGNSNDSAISVSSTSTLGDWVALLARHGFRITDLLEPEWPEGHDRVWGGWSQTRGRLTPGTALFGADWEPR